MMTEILVIGASGNIGETVVSTLMKENIHVRAATSKENNLPAPTDQITHVHFDFLRTETYEFALGKAEKVFFIRPPQLAKPKEEIFPFLSFLKEKKVSHVVFVSLLGVEKNPVTPHHKIEKEMVRLELPYTFLRPSFFMQNLNTTHLEDIQKWDDLFIPAGKAKTSFIDTRDIGEAAAICLLDTGKYTGKAFDLTGSKALTYEEIAQILTKTLGRAITYSKPSLLKFRSTMIKRGEPKEFVNVMVMLYFITQLGNAKKVTTDLEQLLGRTPTSFEQYALDYQAYFQ